MPSFLCLVRPSPRLPARSRSASAAGVAALACHIAAAAIVISLATWARSIPRQAPGTTSESLQVPRLVFLVQPVAGGGGGGGGGRQPEPPSKARAVGRDRLTVPVVKRADIQPSTSAEAPRQEVFVNAKPLVEGNEFLTGAPEALASLSRGPGDGEGVGGGTGPGIGSGTGAGIGAGSGGEFGGGAYRLGNGVTPPALLKQVTPKYTADAMRQRIQGLVALEVVISREGIPIAIRVTRSLDPGLDGEAVAAARQWRFTPGRVGDTPVDVVVTILLDFNVR